MTAGEKTFAEAHEILAASDHITAYSVQSAQSVRRPTILPCNSNIPRDLASGEA